MDTLEEIISKFELYTDDTTELSTEEEQALALQKTREIVGDSVWQFMRTKFAGTLVNGECDIPTDFGRLMPNYSEDETNYIPNKVVVWVGGSPYDVRPMGARNFNGSNFFYIDYPRRKLVGVGILSGTFECDYQPIPDSVLDIPVDYRMVIVWAMLIDDEIIQKVEKARSNLNEHAESYRQVLGRMRKWDNSFLLN